MSNLRHLKVLFFVIHTTMKKMITKAFLIQIRFLGKL